MIDISEHIPEVEQELLTQLAAISVKTGYEFLLIGASARDFLGYRYGLEQKRATEDTDIAIKVASWEEFQAFKDALLEEGFTEVEGKPHRLISQKGRLLDVVPHGGIADADQNIRWPPDQVMEMSVLGFEDGLTLSEDYIVAQSPQTSIKVTSLEGFICLKFLSWLDRPGDLKGKDAQDIRHILESSEKIYLAEVYEDMELLETHSYDNGLAASRLIGRNVKSVVSQKVLETVIGLKTSTDMHRDWEEFVLDMRSRKRVSDDDTDISRKLLETFFAGLTE